MQAVSLFITLPVKTNIFLISSLELLVGEILQVFFHGFFPPFAFVVVSSSVLFVVYRLHCVSFVVVVWLVVASLRVVVY